MNPVVSFDCAETLLSVDWRPVDLALDSAQALGLDGDGPVYERILRSRWGEFREVNLTGDLAQADLFWHSLTEEWAAGQGWPKDTVDHLVSEAHRRLYGPESTVFRLFDDVEPCLTALAAAGVRMCVVSNWDISLERTLESFGLRPLFEAVVASMAVGAEKPDPAIFHEAARRMDCPTSQMIHVGDNPLDDLIGARNAGATGYVIDRSGQPSSPAYLSSLTELPARLGL